MKEQMKRDFELKLKERLETAIRDNMMLFSIARFPQEEALASITTQVIYLLAGLIAATEAEDEDVFQHFDAAFRLAYHDAIAEIRRGKDDERIASPLRFNRRRD